MCESDKASVQAVVHTPGPWRYDRAGMMVHAADAQIHVADLRGWGRLEKAVGEEQACRIMDANGFLIEAAPDLLAALDEFVEVVERVDPGVYCGHVKDARAAIAKARGKSV